MAWGSAGDRAGPRLWALAAEGEERLRFHAAPGATLRSRGTDGFFLDFFAPGNPWKRLETVGNDDKSSTFLIFLCKVSLRIPRESITQKCISMVVKI